MKGKPIFAAGVRIAAFFAAITLAVAALLTAVGNLSGTGSAEGRLRLEEGLRRAAVTCYAEEGIYPPTLDYLKEHYGVQVDESRYAVFYQVFAENLMPDITVLEKERA